MSEESTDQTAATMPTSKADLISQIEREWQALQATVAAADEAALVRPGPEQWSSKDHLSHLATWLEILQKRDLDHRPFEEAAGVDLSKMGGSPTVDEFNAVFFERTKGQSLAQVRDRLEQDHRATLARLQAMSYAELMQPLDASDPERHPVMLEVIWNTYEHYREHNRYIRELLKQ